MIEFGDKNEREKLHAFKYIKLWWKFEGRYYWSDLKQGIKNIIKWLPIIWKDRDYDHSYIYSILEFKLRKQSRYIGLHNRHTTAKRDSEKMLLCAELISKLRDGFYSGEYSEYHKTKFEFLPLTLDGGTDGFELDTTELSENFQDYFNKYPLIYKRVTNTSKFIFNNDTKQHIAMNIGYENERRAKALLYKILESDLEKWWD